MDLKTVAIVGSREFEDYEKFKELLGPAIEKIGGLSAVKSFISGGARGTDSLAERFAKESDIPITVYHADWDKLGKKAGVIRNTEIVNNSDYIIAFPSRSGYGTQDTIQKGQAKGIEVYVEYCD